MRPTFVYLLAFTGIWAWHARTQQFNVHVQDTQAQVIAHETLVARQIYKLDSIDETTNRPRIVGLIKRAFKIEGVDWDDTEVDAMARICWRESRYDPLLQNPDSTAYGLYQFLDSTWQYYGIDKTSDPLLQTIAAVRYIKDRYGKPSVALEFHRSTHEVNGEMVHYY
ncbi:MAG TPA: transglycosylase SLT domain-containing protein [Fimbriimonadaceae bacterium]|nr:transglycosylase SLT domain-containing protein [Fimbriimonadaceae bacterium]